MFEIPRVSWRSVSTTVGLSSAMFMMMFSSGAHNFNNGVSERCLDDCHFRGATVRGQSHGRLGLCAHRQRFRFLEKRTPCARRSVTDAPHQRAFARIRVVPWTLFL